MTNCKIYLTFAESESIIGIYKLDKFKMRKNGLSKIPCGCLRNTLGRLRDTSPSPDSNDPGLVDSRVVDYANTATETCLASCAFDGCELKDRHTRERQEVLPPIV